METDDPFGIALAVAAKRADRLATADLGTSIVLALSNLQSTGGPFRVADYQAAYNRRPLEVFQDFTSRVESVYQQIHALGEAVARLVVASADPALSARNIGELADKVEACEHPLAPEVRGRKREIELLRWLATVRNKAVQHRAKNGYTDNKAIMLTDGFVLIRRPIEPASDVVRKARAMLVGFGREFGLPLDTETGGREIVAYLDLVSHGLWCCHPPQADSARRVIQGAGMHYIVMSASVLDNVAWSVGRVLELAGEHPDAFSR
jgi:hypothetical protein